MAQEVEQSSTQRKVTAGSSPRCLRVPSALGRITEPKIVPLVCERAQEWVFAADVQSGSCTVASATGD